jgi:dihydrofolate reductase
MRKLILEEWISLDGYAADRDGKLDFFAQHVRTSYEPVERMLFREAIDTILLGAKTYTQFAALWPGRTAKDNILAEKMNSAKKIVFSRSLTKAPWGTLADAEIASGDVVQRVGEMKSMPGGNMVVWGSISLAQQLMKADMVDEYHIHVCPLLTGGGLRLFNDDIQSSALNLISTAQYGPGITHLIYQKR